MECPECGKSVQDRATLDAHLDLHASGDGIECQKCGWLYDSKRTLKCHHTKKHSKDPEWTTYECEECGVEVGYHTGADDRVARFCRDCYQEHRSADTVEVVCETCGMTEQVPEYLNDRRFCSPSCRGEWVSENVSGEDHPLWEGGRSGWRGPNWRDQRQKALGRDNHRCQICNSSNQLIVHHIVSYHEFDRDTEANAIENLATLCRSCHGYLEAWIAREDMGVQAQKRAFGMAAACSPSTSA